MYKFCFKFSLNHFWRLFSLHFLRKYLLALSGHTKWEHWSEITLAMEPGIQFVVVTVDSIRRSVDCIVIHAERKKPQFTLKMPSH